MNDKIEIVRDTINYCLSNTNISLSNKVEDIELTDYQFLTSQYFIQNKYLKGLLAFYETGKGKTLMALYIMKNLFKIFDNWRIILLCKASLIKTPWEESIDKYYPELKQKIKIFSFEETNLSVKIGSFINASARNLIVIDEVHIFISRCISKDVGDKRILYQTYKRIRDVIAKSFTNKLLLLSATPIVNNVEEFIFLYNLLNPFYLPISLLLVERDNLLYEEELKRGLLGMISYVKSNEVASFENSDKTERMVGKKIEYIELEPTQYQIDIYKKVDKKEKSLSSRGFRIKRNIACQFVYDGMEANVEFDVQSWIPSDETELKNRSIKFYTGSKMIRDSIGKCIVFEPFVEYGIDILTKYLDFFKVSYGIFSGSDAVGRYKELEEFENINNRNGEMIKVFIISNAAREGLSFTYIRNMFIFSSSWNEAALSQIIGRSIRLDSHKGSDIDFVSIYFMHIKIKNLLTADEEIFEIMLNKFKIFNKIYKILKESSIENIIEKYSSNKPESEKYKELYYMKLDEKNKTSEKFVLEEDVEVIYYSYDRLAKYYYLGYKKENKVYDENGTLVGMLNAKLEMKIMSGKLVYIIDHV